MAKHVWAQGTSQSHRVRGAALQGDGGGRHQTEHWASTKEVKGIGGAEEEAEQRKGNWGHGTQPRQESGEEGVKVNAAGGEKAKG